MSVINRDYILAPFQNLLAACQSNVLLGLRMVERMEILPGPTEEELLFIQVSPGGQDIALDERRSMFKRWIVMNGFGDIQKCIRVTLERLLAFMTLQKRISSNE